MKPSKIKAWPELVDFMPCLNPMREVRGHFDRSTAAFEIDFGTVRSVSSTGLTLFLLRLLRLLDGRGNIHIRRECAPTIWAELERLGAFSILNNMAKGLQHEFDLGLFSSTKPEDNHGRVSLPIIPIVFGNASDRRNTLHSFVRYITDKLMLFCKPYNIQVNGLVMLLNEIAKNAADHSKSEALFGFDIVPINKKQSRLTFAFGDLGIGIKQHIVNNLRPEESKRREHMSLYEAYLLALKPGYTSSASCVVNKGHGMSIIVDCASSMGLHLSIFDANSRGMLSSLEAQPSHAAVRRVFHNTGSDPGFSYYGEAILMRNKNDRN